MSMAPRLLLTAPRTVLRGGCAPGECQKDLQRLRKRGDALERACAWLASGLPDELPRLRSRPLLGDCLSELVDELSGEADMLLEREERGSTPRLPSRRETPPAFPELKPQKPRRSHGPSPDGPRAKGKPDFKPDETSARRPEKGAPSASPAKADRALLERMAGPVSKRTPAIRSKSLAGKSAGKSQGALLPGKISRPGSPAHHHPQPEGERRPPAWVQRAAERIHGAFEGYPLRAARPASSHPEFPDGGAGLEQQWGWLLSGETIPGERIEALGSASRREPPPEPRRRPPQSGTEETGSHPVKSDLRDAFSLPYSEREAEDPYPVKGSLTHTGEVVQALAGAPHDPGESLAGPAPRFAPPQIAPTLPPLRPVQWPSVELTPAAAFTAERSARREEVEAGPDDLDELSRKLRRILEEEARRHGIEV